jgi:hypothetical protein
MEQKAVEVEREDFRVVTGGSASLLVALRSNWMAYGGVAFLHVVSNRLQFIGENVAIEGSRGAVGTRPIITITARQRQTKCIGESGLFSKDAG